MVTVTYLGENPLPVFGRLMLPEERRDFNPKQIEQLQEIYPGMFEAVRPQASVEKTERESARVVLAAVDGLDELGLSARVVEALRVAGVMAADLVEMDDSELLAISGIGDAAVKEIREALERGLGEWTD